MFKIFLKRKYLVVILILLCIVYTCVVKYRKFKEPTRIFEIKNTQEIYYSRDVNIATIKKRYMIIKPPEDLHELKLLVENFNDENPIDIKMVEDDIVKNCNITADKIHETVVDIYFYRESRRLPRNWQPNEAHMCADTMEHHGDDCIAGIVYSDLDKHKYYSVFKKRKDGKSLIPIERIEYTDDVVVRHESEKGTN